MGKASKARNKQRNADIAYLAKNGRDASVLIHMSTADLARLRTATEKRLQPPPGWQSYVGTDNLLSILARS